MSRWNDCAAVAAIVLILGACSGSTDDTTFAPCEALERWAASDLCAEGFAAGNDFHLR